ncbi:hypothetical protein [Brevibacillus daliensis]|uniref:hypothetical protein n=1 Tax=Brevibacillus daliensis TaxID=2892995 RepID=UPI001E3AC915|nr:hypothetical protein [Brevibacillus daliensis]
MIRLLDKISTRKYLYWLLATVIINTIIWLFLFFNFEIVSLNVLVIASLLPPTILAIYLIIIGCYLIVKKETAKNEKIISIFMIYVFAFPVIPFLISGFIRGIYYVSFNEMKYDTLFFSPGYITYLVSLLGITLLQPFLLHHSIKVKHFTYGLELV